jgi:PAT family beta-lactamase induction signal transducer AmpG
LPVDWGQVPIPFVTEPLRGPGGLITLEPVHFSPLLQFVIFLETGTLGLSWGALGVMLLRLTDKRFSATQYALFSSLVGMARTFVGPPAGVMADALGWRDFFFASMLAGIPGLIMLGLIVPWGRESKEFTGESVEPLPPGPPWSKRILIASGLAAAVAMGVTSMLLSGLMAAIKQWRGDVGKTDRAFHFLDGLERVARPESWKTSIDLASALVFGVVAGVAVAAYMAARGRPVRPRG